MNKQGGLMEKCVLLSIRPQYCELICNGKKTIEVRKSRPKLDTPFKCYIYCTLSGSPEAFESWGKDVAKWNRENWGERKGKVIGEFVCDELSFVAPPYGSKTERTCLTAPELYDYSLKGVWYWHISALQIYGKPTELSEFHKPEMPTGLRYEDDTIKRPPQSWGYVEEYDGKR